MKKIINSVFLLAFFLFSCGGNQEENTSENGLNEPIKFIVGIGKVLPKGGIVNLSTAQGGKIIKIYKQLGDTVQKGEVLFEMEALSQQLQVEQSKAVLETANQSLQSLDYDIQAAEIKLASLKKEFETSKRLRAKKAETDQKVFKDSIAYDEQLANVKRQKQNYLAQKASLNEKRIAVRSNQVAASDKTFKSLQDGVLIRFDVTVGSVLNPNAIFGELAPKTQLVVEGELDELYTNKLLKGQKVDLLLVGKSEIIAKGIVDFVGTSLQNKSIIYETIGEGSDRRVLRFTVRITEGQKQLLINQKVECKIQL